MMVIKPVSELVARARARIEEIAAADVIAMRDDPGVVIVDIRDVRERQRGHIPGSFHCPRGMAEFWVDPASPYHKDIFAQDKRFVFYCASGWRSALTVAALNDMGFDCAHMREGFSGWETAGGPVERDEQRQGTLIRDHSLPNKIADGER
jgi:rhodanese-related sulfurtransferase